jgi:hypothetical protein
MKKHARVVPFQVLVGLFACLWAASAQADDPPPRIAPIHTTPAGQTYGRWAAEWWQWALGIPEAVNPLTDPTGAHCAQRQVDEVWFLAGSVATDPVVRRCEVPAGKALFFPLINTFYGAFLNDPPDTRTEPFVRAMGSCTEPAQITVWIDDVTVHKPTRFFTGASGSQSPIFNVQLPPAMYWGWTTPRCPSWSSVRAPSRGTTCSCGRSLLVPIPSGGSPRDARQGTPRTSRTSSRWLAVARAVEGHHRWFTLRRS